MSYLETICSSAEAKEKYARALWQEFPPMDSNPPLLAGDLPGKLVGSLTAQDVCVVHLATISFSGLSMVCEPTVDKCLKLVDETLTRIPDLSLRRQLWQAQERPHDEDKDAVGAQHQHNDKIG